MATNFHIRGGHASRQTLVDINHITKLWKLSCRYEITTTFYFQRLGEDDNVLNLMIKLQKIKQLLLQSPNFNFKFRIEEK